MTSARPRDLFGTDEPVPDRRLLRAGALTAILEDGNLRSIRFGGVEVLRAIGYLSRDASWGTYKAALSDVEIVEDADSFTVVFNGLCGLAERFAYRMEIRGHASGRLAVTAEGEALTDFQTNRTGFVILHPADVAGTRLSITHGDGAVEETAFPRLISADQPAYDIAALAHEPVPGLLCRVETEGDAFEMEDQRNWSDASFKTYVRPLAKPRPYLIPAGSKDRQRISVEVAGNVSAAAARPSGTAATVVLEGSVGRMPRMALFLDAGLPLSAGTRLAADFAQALIVRFDAGGAGGDADVAGLALAADIAASVGASTVVELVLDGLAPAAEARGALYAFERAGIAPSAVMIAPRREFRTRPTGALPKGEHPVDAMVTALREAGFPGPIGAGTPSYFTEFNRNPPGREGDFVFFSIAANVHAADDVSVVETLDVYPQLIESAQALCPQKDIWLGPCTIGVRHNPYGAGVAPNPQRLRVPSARDDPRHAALFGAAFAVGVAARAAAKVQQLCLAAPEGPFGMTDSGGNLRPVGVVQGELARAADAECFALRIDHPGVAGIAFRSGEGLCALLSNLTPNTVAATLPKEFLSARLIDSDAQLRRLDLDANRILLPPYRTASLASSSRSPKSRAP